MITLQWVPLEGADVSSYRVYRSMVGFRAALPSPSDLSGLTLILSVNGTTAQGITFDGVDDAVTAINTQLTGARAYAAADPDAAYLYVRSNIRTAPGSIEVVGGTALVLLNLAPRVITERSESQLLATVAVLTDPTATVSYDDPDGVSDDFYAVSTVDHLGDESLKSSYRRPVTATGNLCMLEGLVMDMTGRRIADAEVVVTPAPAPQGAVTGAQVSKRPLRTLTGPDGRYALPVLQGLSVQIEIHEIGFSRVVVVPATLFANVADLASDDSAQLQIDYNLGAL